MENSPTKKSVSVLGIISILIAVCIGICYFIFQTLTIIYHDSDKIFIWAFPTLITAPIGIIFGLIAVFTKRAWVGLVLNILLLIFDVLIIFVYVLAGVTAFR